MKRLPVLSYRKVIAILRLAGFVEIQGGGKGSHHTLYHPDDPTNIVTVPHHRDVKRATLRVIIESAGLTVAEFFDLL